jgi:hypothetical protein
MFDRRAVMKDVCPSGEEAAKGRRGEGKMAQTDVISPYRTESAACGPYTDFRRRCRYWSATTAAMMTPPLMISW